MEQVRNAEVAENLKTCPSGMYESLCDEDILTSLQKKQLIVARVAKSNRRKSGSSSKPDEYDQPNVSEYGSDSSLANHER